MRISSDGRALGRRFESYIRNKYYGGYYGREFRDAKKLYDMFFKRPPSAVENSLLLGWDGILSRFLKDDNIKDDVVSPSAKNDSNEDGKMFYSYGMYRSIYATNGWDGILQLIDNKGFILMGNERTKLRSLRLYKIAKKRVKK